MGSISIRETKRENKDGGLKRYRKEQSMVPTVTISKNFISLLSKIPLISALPENSLSKFCVFRTKCYLTTWREKVSLQICCLYVTSMLLYFFSLHWLYRYLLYVMIYWNINRFLLIQLIWVLCWNKTLNSLFPDFWWHLLVQPWTTFSDQECLSDLHCTCLSGFSDR